MKIRSIMLALIAFFVLAGSVVPANAQSGRHHRRHHRHHRQGSRQDGRQDNHR